jgi:FSR family fosmidomycin resistance protein-like MFS transporter
LFLGGALGKASCSGLGERLGVIGSVVGTEGATALFIVATLFVPLPAMLAILPLLGIVLNGMPSVLHSTVPELALRGDAGRAFAMFYTAVLGASCFAPILHGTSADHSRTIGVLAGCQDK